MSVRHTSRDPLRYSTITVENIEDDITETFDGGLIVSLAYDTEIEKDIEGRWHFLALEQVEELHKELGDWLKYTKLMSKLKREID